MTAPVMRRKNGARTKKSGGAVDRKSSGTKNLLQVGVYQVLTNLTVSDLANPKLWTMRTPHDWARAIDRVGKQVP